MTENNTNNKKALLKYIIPAFLVLLLIAIIVSVFASGGNDNNSSNPTVTQVPQVVESRELEEPKKEVELADEEDLKLSQQFNSLLKVQRENIATGVNYNWYMGWWDVESKKACVADDGTQLIDIPVISNDSGASNSPERLASLIPAPENPEKVNAVVYEKYGVDVPLVYPQLSDMFTKKEDGTLDLTKTIDTGDTESPMQKKLEEGVILLPIAPQPGDVGNSYISGHTSNFLSVNSEYNEAFRPFMNKGEIGDTFYVYDCEGRQLAFNVFEAAEYEDNADLLWTNTDKRQVTLQGSILKTCTPELAALCQQNDCAQGNLCATHRWIVKGELDLEETKTLNGVTEESTEE